MLYLSISFTLLVLLASLHLLIKVKKEGLGSSFKWGCYLIMLAAMFLLLCQLVCGVIKMRHHFCQSRAMMGQCDGMYGGGMGCHRDGMMQRGCCHEMGCCDGGGMKCMDGKDKCDDGKMMKCDKDTTKSCCKDKHKGNDDKDKGMEQKK
jgi:hypothetical protein